MNDALRNVFLRITQAHSEDDVLMRVEEAYSEYVWDWEDEFDTLEEAYEEQGRGEAEDQVLSDLIHIHSSAKLELDEFCTLRRALADFYGLVIV